MIIFIILLWIIYNCVYIRPTSFDTTMIFGDGTYQILKGTTLDGFRDYELFCNDKLILSYVYKYKDDKKNHVVYLIGKDKLEYDYVFIVLDYKKNKEEKYTCNNLDDKYYNIFVKEINQFNKLKKNMTYDTFSDNVCNAANMDRWKKVK
jgi:hypothetical protein